MKSKGRTIITRKLFKKNNYKTYYYLFGSKTYKSYLLLRLYLDQEIILKVK